MGNNATIYGFTETAKGLIPHKRHASGIDMPVKVQNKVRKLKNGSCLPMPKRWNGLLVYALPGGNEYVDFKSAVEEDI